MGRGLHCGGTWVNAFGLPGDALGAQAIYSEGAVGYNTSAYGSWAMMGSGNKVALSYLVDGIFNTDTPVYLTRNWSMSCQLHPASTAFAFPKFGSEGRSGSVATRSAAAVWRRPQMANNRHHQRYRDNSG
jgi:hypothetical protein